MSEPGVKPIEYRRPQPPGVSERLCRGIGVATICYHAIVVVASMLYAGVGSMALDVLQNPGTTRHTLGDVLGASAIVLVVSLPHVVAGLMGLYLLRTAKALTDNRDLGVRRCERYYFSQLFILLIAWFATAGLAVVMKSHSPWGISSIVTAIAAILPLVIANRVIVAKDPAYQDDYDTSDT